MIELGSRSIRVPRPDMVTRAHRVDGGRHRGSQRHAEGHVLTITLIIQVLLRLRSTRRRLKPLRHNSQFTLVMVAWGKGGEWCDT